MAHCSTLIGQLLPLIPRPVFDHLVDTHAWQGPNPRKFTYWSHLGAMLFGQWSARKSLRDLVFSVNRQVRKCYHLGLAAVKRSTLADANQQRPAIIFEKTYYQLYERVSAELATQPQEAPEIKIIDATTIDDLCAAVFPWAKFRTRKGAIKLHTDQLMRLSSPLGQTYYPELWRRVHYLDPEGKAYVCLTNRRDLPALEVAELYRRRGQIELFFKWIKQNLQIKAFYGTSKNAVLMQIWTALIAYVLLVWLKFKSKTGWGLLQLSRLAQTMLLERMDWWSLLCPRPPDNRQPLPFN
jgi:hypothetical protein